MPETFVVTVLSLRFVLLAAFAPACRPIRSLGYARGNHVCQACVPWNRKETKVAIVAGFHLFPFRTEKLSPPAPMVLHTRGRVGSRRLFFRKPLGAIPGAFVVVYTPSPRAGSGPVLSCQQLQDMLSLPFPSSLMILGFQVRPDISSS